MSSAGGRKDPAPGLKIRPVPPYQIRSRRPIAGVFRRTARVPVRWCLVLGVHPNLISCSSVVASLAAALCFWQAGALPWLLLPGVGFCYLRLWLNMLDGMVAVAAGKASRTGEIANELPDRFSDVLSSPALRTATSASRWGPTGWRSPRSSWPTSARSARR
jgi:hypothetical protein